jgi:hypothetical protein
MARRGKKQKNKSVIESVSVKRTGTPEPRDKSVLEKYLLSIDDGVVTMAGAVSGILAFVIPLILYAHTAMREPGVQGDYTKFVILAKVWGIPHSTGFPLYLILSGLWWFMPISPPVFKMALLSSIFVALSMHFLFRTCRLLGMSPFIALGLVLFVATGRTIWWQGEIPEVYGLHILLLIATVWALVKWDVSGNDKYFYVAVWFCILSFGNHLTALFSLPGLLIFSLVRKPSIYLRGKTWIHASAAIVVVACLYSYIFFRSGFNPAHNEGFINRDIHRMLDYLLAKDYSSEWSY